MYGVIYVDVLVLVNTIAGWFMLRCAAAFARRAQRPARMLTAAVTAGFSSLVILLPPLPAVAATAIKLALAGAVVRIAFPFENARVFAKSCAAFFAANMLCAAAAFAAVQAGVRGVSANNGMVYIRVSPVLLILCILGVYAAVEGWDFLFGSGAAKSLRSFQAVVMGTTLSGTALLDSGFRANDPIFGTPLVLFSYPQISPQLPESFREKLEFYFDKGEFTDTARGFALTGVRTAGGLCLLPTAPMQSFSLRGQKPGMTLRAAFSKEKFADGQFCAIVPAQLDQS